MNADLPFWHKRYQEQAGWTLQTRRRILDAAGAQPGRLLEVGCGTGAVLESIAGSHPQYPLHGLDIDFASLGYLPNYRPVCANGEALPYRSDSFAVCCCHYLLLWLDDPLGILREMRRVLAPGGLLAVLAEPDYLARIDTPTTAAELGKQQNLSLLKQGARLDAGRQVGPLLLSLGLEEVAYGIIGAEWQGQSLPASLEPAVLQKDLQRLGKPAVQAAANSAGIVFVPTFFGSGKKPRDF